MGRPKREKDKPPRVTDYDQMTTINISKTNKDKVAVIVDWLERENYKKTQEREGYILNDGVSYLLNFVKIDQFL